MYLLINQSITDYWFQSLIIWLLILLIFTERSYAFNCAYYLNKMLTFVSLETYLKSVRNSDIIVINTLTTPKTVKPVINRLQPYVHWLQIKYNVIRQELNIYSGIFVSIQWHLHIFKCVIKVQIPKSNILGHCIWSPFMKLLSKLCLGSFA